MIITRVETIDNRYDVYSLIKMDRKVAIRHFFKHLEQNLTESESEYLHYLQSSMEAFSKSECVSNAQGVYSMFTGLFRLENSQGDPLVSLMDTMKTYEEKASVMTESQRDHYVHSVNVFLLGIYIYASSDKFREAFRSSGEQSTFENVDERFLYVWGHAALFHDIGYPMEIAFNQAKMFTRSIAGIGRSKKRADVSMFVTDFDVISRLSAVKWGGEGYELDLFSPIADFVSVRLGIDRNSVYDVVSRYNGVMRDGRFVDHGYYSSLILMRSLATSMQLAGKTKDRFDSEVVEAASAILLHNFYRRVFTDAERYGFGCGPMSLNSFPMAFLLILCDELQEWNRRKYGIMNKSSIYPDNSRVNIGRGVLTINYRTVDQEVCSTFASDKLALLRSLLDLDGMFDDVKITCSCDRSADMLLSSIEDRIPKEYPRPMLRNIELLAREIHSNYNRKRLIEKPEEPLEYPTWDSLPQDLRYSNIMQAMDIPEKLAAIGCHVGMKDEGVEVESFNPTEVLMMAKLEHRRWREERESNGWIWGPQKDVENRISPYIAEWDEIPVDIQKYDIEAVENIIPLLNSIGLRVLRDE